MKDGRMMKCPVHHPNEWILLYNIGVNKQNHASVFL